MSKITAKRDSCHYQHHRMLSTVILIITNIIHMAILMHMRYFIIATATKKRTHAFISITSIVPMITNITILLHLGCISIWNTLQFPIVKQMGYH